jgi:L-alanine-DL-glutamate epimerase-like enolase superfamily enzyme
MQVTRVERIDSIHPVELPEPWLPAWREPDGDPDEAFGWSILRVHTDVGVTGTGPAVGDPEAVDLVGFDPHEVGALWQNHLSGSRAGTTAGVAGLEIALWDALGKAVDRPVCELLGRVSDRVPVYGATSRLLDPDDLVATAEAVQDASFSGVKVRAHRPDPADDVAAVRAVREAVGDRYPLYVDANQNNHSAAYDFWTLATARRMAREFDALGVAFLEEPRPRSDVEGLADVGSRVDLSIAGGEHSPTPRAFRPHLAAGAYDILQPDVQMFGNVGIEGLRQTAALAAAHDRRVVPHVIGDANFGLGMAATLQAAGATGAIDLVEFPYDPPVLTPETLQPLLAEPILPNEDGTVTIPDGPGLGVELDGDEIENNGDVVWSRS